MGDKERVIVIDLMGEDEQGVVRAERAGSHECSCGVCTCHEKHQGEEQLELQLQVHEFAAPGAQSAGRLSRPPATSEFGEPGELAKKYFLKN